MPIFISGLDRDNICTPPEVERNIIYQLNMYVSTVFLGSYEPPSLFTIYGVDAINGYITSMLYLQFISAHQTRWSGCAYMTFRPCGAAKLSRYMHSIQFKPIQFNPIQSNPIKFNLTQVNYKSIFTDSDSIRLQHILPGAIPTYEQYVCFKQRHNYIILWVALVWL